MKASHVTGCTVCQAHICEHVLAEVEGLGTNERCSNEEINRLRDSLEGANRENERLRSLLRIAQTVTHSRRQR